jgi:threonine/homoserine/homoserine lactone efflux protein
VLATSATAFTVVRTAGGLYLVWLGIRRWRDRSPVLAVGEVPPSPRSDRRALLEGLAVNALNPKVALFFLAFLPPFVDPARGRVLAQSLVLGLVVVVVLLVGDALFGLVTGSVGRAWVGRLASPRSDRWARGAIGAVYAGLGVAALLGGHGPSAGVGAAAGGASAGA